MRLSDQIIDDIERRLAAELGKTTFEEFQQTMHAVVVSFTRPTDEPKPSDYRWASTRSDEIEAEQAKRDEARRGYESIPHRRHGCPRMRSVFSGREWRRSGRRFGALRRGTP
jgi:hypothetical protein